MEQIQSPEFELAVITIAAALGIYVAGARIQFIFEARKETDKVRRKKLRRQVYFLLPAVYGVFGIALLATISALWTHWQQSLFLFLLFAEFLYLLVLHVYSDIFHLLVKPK